MGRQSLGGGPGLALALLGQPGIGNAGSTRVALKATLNSDWPWRRRIMAISGSGRGQKEGKAVAIRAACPSAGNSLCKIG